VIDLLVGTAPVVLEDVVLFGAGGDGQFLGHGLMVGMSVFILLLSCIYYPFFFSFLSISLSGAKQRSNRGKVGLKRVMIES
jgi:hypothetical protein